MYCCCLHCLCVDLCTCVFEESVRAEANVVRQVTAELFRPQTHSLVVAIRCFLGNKKSMERTLKMLIINNRGVCVCVCATEALLLWL